jgi:hypothetical protein
LHQKQPIMKHTTTVLKVPFLLQYVALPRVYVSTLLSTLMLARCKQCLVITLVIILVPALFFCTACQQGVGVVLDLPHDEKIVVRGLLVAGEPLSDIQISRTLAPLEVFSYDKVFVSDADVRVSTGDTTYVLVLQTNSTTASVPRSLYQARSVRVVAGRRYNITVRWRGLRAEAATTVPLPAQIESSRLVMAVVPTQGALQGNTSSTALDTVLVVESTIRPRPGDVYRIGAELTGTTTATRGAGDAVLIPANLSSSNLSPLVLRTESWRGVARWLPFPATTITSIIQTFDTDFYQHFLTRNRGGQPDLLNPSGPNIEWNVRGDGLGMWVGMAVARQRVPR